MKKLIIALAALMVSIAAYGQGQFNFNNRVLPDINAKFYLQGVDQPTGTTSSIGNPDWSIQLLGGPQGTPVAQLTPLTPNSVQFRGAAGSNLAGYVSQVVTVPGVAIGGNASVLLRLTGPNGFTQDFGPYNVTGLGGETTLPPNLALGNQPLGVVPEPSTMVLAALGLGALLAIRRRK